MNTNVTTNMNTSTNENIYTNEKQIQIPILRIQIRIQI